MFSYSFEWLQCRIICFLGYIGTLLGCVQIVFLLSAFTNILTEIPMNNIILMLWHFIFSFHNYAFLTHLWPFTGNRIIHGGYVIRGLRIIISGSKKRKLALKFETVCFPSTWNSIECKWRLSLVAVKLPLDFSHTYTICCIMIFCYNQLVPSVP